MFDSEKPDKIKSFLKKVALIIALEILIIAIVFIVLNFQVVMIYITTSESLKYLIAYLIDLLFY
jgi:hypothetical protein